MTLQLTIDCSDPQKMVTFWAEALDYVPEPPPGGHATWRTYWASMGVSEEELPPGAGDIPESIIDPAGRGPRVWFQQVPEPKAAKNRWHFDLKVGGGPDAPPGHPRTAGQGYDGTAGQSWCHGAADQGRAGHGALRGRHAGPRRQRIRRHLRAVAAALVTAIVHGCGTHSPGRGTDLTGPCPGSSITGRHSASRSTTSRQARCAC